MIINRYQADSPMSCSLLITIGNKNNKAKKENMAANPVRISSGDNADSMEKANPGNRNSFLFILPVVFSFILVFKVLCSGTGPYLLVVLVPGMINKGKVVNICNEKNNNMVDSAKRIKEASPSFSSDVTSVDNDAK